MKVRLPQRSITILAPRPVVFELISSFSEGDTTGEFPVTTGERNKSLKREGNRLGWTSTPRTGARHTARLRR